MFKVKNTAYILQCFFLVVLTEKSFKKNKKIVGICHNIYYDVAW